MHRHLPMVVLGLFWLGLSMLPQTLQAQLVADFDFTPNAPACPPAQVQFTDQSTGGATSWAWGINIFGGNWSTQQNPTFNFWQPGTYDITLTVSDGTNTASVTKQIVIGGPLIDVSQITVGPVTGCAPLTTTISYQGTINPGWTYDWDMGDGTVISNPANPTSFNHVYGTPGWYSINLTVDDGNGCVVNYWIPDSLVVSGGLCLSGTVNNVTCGASNAGSIDLTVNGGTPPFTYDWSNGATTEDITGLSDGTYTVTVTDNTGASETASFSVDNTDLDLDFVTTKSLCDSSGGSILLNITGGVPPYSILWNTGATVSSINPAIPGGYSVTVQDANGCSDHEVVFVEFEDSCRVKVSGKVYFDVNQNCSYDAGVDYGITGVIFETENQYVVHSNPLQGGTYSVTVPAGPVKVEPYELNNPNVGSWISGLFLPPHYSFTCPNPASYDFGITAQDQPDTDFGVQVVPGSNVNDLFIDMHSSWFRPGFQNHTYIRVRNRGTNVANPVVTLVYDDDITYVSTTPAATSHDPVTRTVTWNLAPLGPLEYIPSLKLTGYLDPTTPLGTPIYELATVTPLAGDLTPTDNQDTIDFMVTGSYDPNDKQVEPRGESRGGNVDISQEWFTYKIRFQNTGTDTAFFVTIRDTIDDDFQIGSLDILDASHPYFATFTESRGVEFRFDNILLPDSSTDLEGSQGYIRYRIKRRDDVGIGTQFTNRAAIYFDFNAPIITNTTVNTLVQQTTGVRDIYFSDLRIFPNPAKEVLYIQAENEPISRLELTDLRGRVLLREDAHSLTHALKLNSLPQGLYLLKLYREDQVLVEKVEVE